MTLSANYQLKYDSYQQMINCKLVDQSLLYNFAVDYFLLSLMISEI